MFHMRQIILPAIMALLVSGVCGRETNRQDQTTMDAYGQTGMAKALPESVGMSTAQLARIDNVMSNAISAHETSGGVVLVARFGKVAFEKAYGLRATEPDTEEATVDTIYDLASLTKVVATASAVMRLVEQGKIRLADPVWKYIPEWKNSDEETSRIQEIARARRLARQGAVRFSPESFSFADPGSSESVSWADAPSSNTRLWNRLVSDGQVRPSQKYFDEMVDFAERNRESITIRHLLTHTSGLDPFDNYYLKFPEGNARQKIIANIARRKLQYEPGEKFVYSDLNYITVGEIVERVSGQDLNTFCRREIYQPLGMTHTMFNPDKELRSLIAPTEWRTRETSGGQPQKLYMIRGEVHDGNAFVQNGISGHAGLFSSAPDLAVFCQMLLNQGEYNGVRIFSPATVKAMTQDQAHLKSGEKRGYGWDLQTGYSGQRGDLFTTGFGHTGWTGTSIWVVPEAKLFIVILTNRVHPDGTGDAGPLRSKIANVIATSIVGSVTENNEKEDRQ